MAAAEELRAAAAKLREAKEQTSSQGPWRSHQMSVQAEDRPIAMAYQCYADATWIALMHPGVAEPLAAWLEVMAGVAQYAAQRGYTTSAQTEAALTVARALNGGA